jgi:hypothetical protein
MWQFFKRKYKRETPVSSLATTTGNSERKTVPYTTEGENDAALLSAEKIIEAFEHSNKALTSEIEYGLDSPQARQRLYKILIGRAVAPYATLFRKALAKEVEYRDALWHGTVEDDGDCYQGIYRCAFLIYRLRSLDNVHTLWAAKHLNMDVGSSMGAEFFIGAGLEVTISYLAESNLPDSGEISDYIAGWFSQDDAEEWQEDWEADMASKISNV